MRRSRQCLGLKQYNRATFTYVDLHFGSDQTASGAAIERPVSTTFYSRSSRATSPNCGALGARLQHVIPPNVDFGFVFVVILFMADFLCRRVVRMSAMAQSSSAGKITPEYERRRNIASLPTWFNPMRRNAAECDEDARRGKIEWQLRSSAS